MPHAERNEPGPERAGHTRPFSIRSAARIAAVLNLGSGLPDGFSVTVLRKLAVRGDAAATAANILGSEPLFRLGFVADLVGLVIFVASGVMLYQVFKPAGRRLALLYLVFLVMLAVFQSMEAIYDLAALSLLRGGPGLNGVPAAQAQALAYMFVWLHSSTYQLGLFFGGCSDLMIAWLIVQSTFLPRIFAPLMLIDSLGLFVFTLGGFISPPLVARIFPLVPFGTFAIGSGVLYLWMIIRGVNAERWQAQATV